MFRMYSLKTVISLSLQSMFIFSLLIVVEIINQLIVFTSSDIAQSNKVDHHNRVSL